MPTNSSCSTAGGVPAKASGTSRNASATYRPRCTPTTWNPSRAKKWSPPGFLRLGGPVPPLHSGANRCRPGVVAPFRCRRPRRETLHPNLVRPTAPGAARARLCQDPDLLVLDEPFHGLDAGKKRLCGALVETLARQRDQDPAVRLALPGRNPPVRRTRENPLHPHDPLT